MYRVWDKKAVGQATNSNGEIITLYNIEIDVDTPKDLPEIQENWNIAIAHVISTGNFYSTNGSGEWIIQTEGSESSASESKPSSSEWAKLTNAQILSADFIQQMSDGKWLVRVEIMADTVEDLPGAEDFPDWHLSTGSVATTSLESNRYTLNTKGVWNRWIDETHKALIM